MIPLWHLISSKYSRVYVRACEKDIPGFCAERVHTIRCLNLWSPAVFHTNGLFAAHNWYGEYLTPSVKSPSRHTYLLYLLSSSTSTYIYFFPSRGAHEWKRVRPVKRDSNRAMRRRATHDDYISLCCLFLLLHAAFYTSVYFFTARFKCADCTERFYIITICVRKAPRERYDLIDFFILCGGDLSAQRWWFDYCRVLALLSNVKDSDAQGARTSKRDFQLCCHNYCIGLIKKSIK